MKNQIKKVLCILLATIICLGSITLSSSALGTEPLVIEDSNSSFLEIIFTPLHTIIDFFCNCFNLVCPFCEDELIVPENIRDNTTEKTIEASTDQAINGVQVNYKLKFGTASVVVEETDGIINTVSGKIGTPIDINIVGDDELENATISFTYSDSLLPQDVNESNLGIVWFDEVNNKMVLLENSNVNIEKNIISVNTNHFSKYVVVDTVQWHSHWAHKQLVSRIDGETLRFNIVLCLDDSGSMSGTRKTVCQQSARNFVDELLPGDNIAVVKFTSSSSTLVYPTEITETNKESIKNKIVLKASGGTNFNTALSTAISHLNSMDNKTENNELLKKYIVFISDGEASVSDSNLSQLVKYGYNVIAIGVGNSSSSSALKKMAETSGGSYTYVSDPQNISSVFEQLQGEYIGLSKDSDGDNIADLVEKSGMISVSGEIYHTDPNDEDTDGDGLSDSYEMGKYNTENGCFEIISSPTTPTYVSDRTTITLHAFAGPLKNNGDTIDAYKNMKISVNINLPQYKLAWDYLNDTVYPNAENLNIEVYLDNKLILTDKIHDAKAGHPININWNSEVDISNHNIVVKAWADNADLVEYTCSYSAYDMWYSSIYNKFNDSTTQLRKAGTTAIRAYGEDLKDAEEAVKDSVILAEGLTLSAKYPKGLDEAIQTKLSEMILDQARSWANKTFVTKDAEDLVKNIANRLSANDEVFTITLGNETYTVTMEPIGVFEAAQFGTVTAINNNTNAEYAYMFSSSPSTINSTINSYMDQCHEIYENSLDDCINAALSDASAILEIDQIKKIIKSKVHDSIDIALAKKGVSLRMETIEKGYDYYENAKKMLSSCQKAQNNPSAKKIESAINAVNNYINFTANM